MILVSTTIMGQDAGELFESRATTIFCGVYQFVCQGVICGFLPDLTGGQNVFGDIYFIRHKRSLYAVKYFTIQAPAVNLGRFL